MPKTMKVRCVRQELPQDPETIQVRVIDEPKAGPVTVRVRRVSAGAAPARKHTKER
jgi:hypothetical protein